MGIQSPTRAKDNLVCSKASMEEVTPMLLKHRLRQMEWGKAELGPGPQSQKAFW